jgi:hypothetical protein
MAWNLANFRKKIPQVSLNQYFEIEISGLDVIKPDADSKTTGAFDDVLNALVRTTEVPTKTLETENVAYYGADYKVNSKATYSDWNVTFMETTANIRNIFLNWTELAYNTKALQNNPHSTYKSNESKVFKLDHRGNSTKRTGVRFYGLWPTTVGPMSFDQAGGSLVTFDVSFTYDYFEIIKRDVSNS